MNMNRRSFLGAALAGATLMKASVAGPASREEGFVPLFDGKTFAGWEERKEAEGTFRIEGGAIVGGTLKDPVKNNEFLCTTAEYANFELRLQVRLIGQSANAGIQIRSRRIPDHFEMIGYQADMGEGYWGCLYDESRRKKVLAQPAPEVLANALKPADWNDYHIRAEGARLQLWLNGVQTVDYTEADTSLEQTGLIALQIHSGPPCEARYRHIRIKSL